MGAPDAGRVVSHEYEIELVSAIARYRTAVAAVFRKWDADTLGVLNGTAFKGYFCCEDLECDCCPEHRELRAASDALDAVVPSYARAGA